MRFDAPHYAFRRFLSPLSSHCFLCWNASIRTLAWLRILGLRSEQSCVRSLSTVRLPDHGMFRGLTMTLNASRPWTLDFAKSLEFVEEPDLQAVTPHGAAGLEDEMDARPEHDADPDSCEDDRKRPEVMPDEGIESDREATSHEQAESQIKHRHGRDGMITPPLEVAELLGHVRLALLGKV